MLVLALAVALLTSPPPAQPFEGMVTSRLSFMVGKWKGTGDGAFFEETWNGFEGKSAIGMFRMVDDKGAVKFQELMGLTVKGDTVELRIRHFDGELHALEDKDKPMVFKLLLVEKQKAIFQSAAKDKLTYARDGDRLRITLEKPEKKPHTFELMLAK